jgi:hypothetical protein
VQAIQREAPEGESKACNLLSPIVLTC